MSNVSIKKEEFEKIDDTNLKLNILFESVIESSEFLKEQIEATRMRFETGDKRVKRLENRKNLNTAASFGGGVAGGIIAIFGKYILRIGD